MKLDFTSFSPNLLRRIVYAGAQMSSFPQARQALEQLLDLRIDPKQIERLTHTIGHERVEERDAACRDWQDLPLMERVAIDPEAVLPDLAVVEMDGGRLQVRSDAPSHSASEKSHWKEDKVGVLLTMQSSTSDVDPCPEIPSVFVDPKRATQLAVEVGKVAVPAGEIPASEFKGEEESEPRAGRPEPLVRSVLATRRTVEGFGPLLASAAHARHFHGANRQAFLADGSSANRGVWERHFSRYVPVLDFIHALSYVYASAMAGRRFDAGWPIYREWIGWVWSGEVHRVIAALRTRQAELGRPEAGESESTPRSVVETALGYLTNHADWMDYARYRKEGLPLMSSAVESTIKQINQRVKGSEKFWSDRGSEAVLQLRADYLSETEPMEDFWIRRRERLNGFRPYRAAA